MIYIDTETSGLNPHVDTVTLFQYITPELDKAVLMPDPDFEQVHALLDQHETIVGHNLPFDLGMLDYIPKQNIEDTLYLSRVFFYEHDKHSLDVLATRVLGYDPYDALDKKAMQKTDWTQELTQEQRDYAALDVEILPEILEYMKESIDSPSYQFDKVSIMDGLKLQRKGLPTLKPQANKQIATYKLELSDLLDEIPFNPNSPKQTAAYLRCQSTSVKVLARLEAKGNEMAGKVRKARQLGKKLNFLKKITEKPRYKGTLAPATRSGRFSSKQNNLQNLPREFKKFIGSKTNVIVSADFAQLELRTIAHITEDKTMTALFEQGKDLHGFSAETLFGENYTKPQRQVAKVLNFSILYGAGAATIADMLLTQTGIVLPEAKIQQLKNKWLATFSGIKRWQNRGGSRHNNNKPWHTPKGRQYKSNRFTDHLSIENQGAGAEVARDALHYIVERSPYLINFVHDSYLGECKNDPAIYQPLCELIYDGMKQAWQNFSDIPMPVDVGVAHNWSDADALENTLYIYGDSNAAT